MRKKISLILRLTFNDEHDVLLADVAHAVVDDAPERTQIVPANCAYSQVRRAVFVVHYGRSGVEVLEIVTFPCDRVVGQRVAVSCAGQRGVLRRVHDHVLAGGYNRCRI